jgi:hypothetical protein
MEPHKGREFFYPLVPADAGTHMWTAPGLQELGSVRIGSLAIICPVC